MSIKDHQGTRKYKFFLPISIILMFLVVVFGPKYFHQIYRNVLLICVANVIYRQGSNLLGCISTTIGFIINLNRKISSNAVKQPGSSKGSHDQNSNIIYAFVIPNYKQDEEMLEKVVEELKNQRRSKQQYAIFLAMEDSEANSNLKAERIIRKFKDCFRAIQYTVHTIKPFEQRGKASNVSYCCQQMDNLFAKNKINTQSVMLVIQDADSLVPEIYIDVLEQKLLENSSTFHFRLFTPFKTMVSIDYSTTCINRVSEKMQLIGVVNCQVGLTGFPFPISHYSLSYNLAKSVGFWDTIPDAIGEDFFMTMKTFWKTNCKVKAERILAPINSQPICTEGYFGNIMAKFWQIQRHMQGSADFGYNVVFFLKNITSFRAWNMMISVLEIRLAPIVLPIILTSISAEQKFTIFNYTFEIRTFVAVYFTVIMIGQVLSYEIISRLSAKYIFKKKIKTFWILELIEFLILSGPLSLVFILIPSIYSSFHVFKGDRVYITAPKEQVNQGPKLRQQ